MPLRKGIFTCLKERMLEFELQVWLIHRYKKEVDSWMRSSCPEMW